MSKFIIGVTGKSGSGKTTVCENIAKTIGAYHIDVDTVCHDVIQDQRRKLEKELIETYKYPINHELFFYTEKAFRRELGELIFSESEKYKDIVSFVWSNAKKSIDCMIEHNDLILLDHILLPVTHYWSMCDKKVLVTCNTNKRYNRILNRDRIDLDYLYKREKASIEYVSYKFDSLYDTTNL